MGVGVLAPHASSILELKSNKKGVLLPRMTKVAMQAITNPATGLLLYCTDCTPNGVHHFNGTEWKSVSPSQTSTTPPVNYVTDNSGLRYEIVTSPYTGRKWLNKDLGANRVATSRTDFYGYGDHFQWGRNADGHQRNPVTASTSTPGSRGFDSRFYTSPNGTWTSFGNIFRLWRIKDPNNPIDGLNNPCPSGFRVPRAIELMAETNRFTAQTVQGAFDSFLKISSGGSRNPTTGVVSRGGDALYATLDFKGDNSVLNLTVSSIRISSTTIEKVENISTTTGQLIRCIKD